MMIVILGPDGCGKSSVIDALNNDLGDTFKTIDYFHLKFRLKPGSQHQNTRTVSNPQGQKTYSPLLSVIKLLYFLIIYNLGYWMHAKRIQSPDHLLIFDRYYHDLIVDPKRFRYGGPEWLTRQVLHWIPAPHLCILLDAPSEVLQARKQEVSFAETTRQRDAYRALVQQLQNTASGSRQANRCSSYIIDAARPLLAVAQEVSTRIRTYQTSMNPSAPSPLIQSVVQQLFPSGAEVVPSSHPAAPDTLCWPYLVIPGKAGHPRWILPKNPTLGLPGLQFWWPYDLASRLRWRLILWAYQLGILHWHPHVQSIQIQWQKFSDWSHLGWENPYPPIPVIYVGEPLARGKAVASLVDSQQKTCQLIAKAPVGKAAADKIRHEAAMLQHLAITQADIAPQLRCIQTDSGLSTQQVLALPSSPRAFSSAHLRYLINLPQTHPTTLAEQGALLQKRLTTCNPAISKPHWQALQGLLKELRSEATPVTSVIVHGDFAPWNLKIKPDGTLIAFDWEEGTLNGLPFYDLLHFHFIQQPIEKRTRALVSPLLEQPLTQEYMQHFTLTPNWCQHLFSYFLLDYWCRRLEEGDGEIADWFFSIILQKTLDETP